MKKNDLIKTENGIFRILSIDTDRVLAIDCINKTMPKFYPASSLSNGEFTTDFLCTKTNGDLMVRECVFRKKLSLPRTCKLLDASRKYWARRGITDWAIVVEEGESADEEE